MLTKVLVIGVKNICILSGETNRISTSTYLNHLFGLESKLLKLFKGPYVSLGFSIRKYFLFIVLDDSYDFALLLWGGSTNDHCSAHYASFGKKLL